MRKHLRLLQIIGRPRKRRLSVTGAAFDDPFKKTANFHRTERFLAIIKVRFVLGKKRSLLMSGPN